MDPSQGELEFRQAYLAAVRDEYRKARNLAEGSMAQVGPEAFDRCLSEGSNSIRVLMQHIGGNLRSRFTDFFTSDGEKTDRRRDQEFEVDPDQGLDAVWEEWRLGWDALTQELDSLRPVDLSRTVTIRGEPHTVVRALERSLAHISYHVGQIVYVAKALRGEAFESLSIPRGGSESFLESVRQRFGAGEGPQGEEPPA